MNPSIEVQITAKLDKLDAALKVAEAKIGSSAVTMGKTGEQAGSMFVDRLVGNMGKGLAMGAITSVLGSGILTALKGINAGKGGEQIGLDIAKGVVDGAKSIPVVGIVVSIFDEMINGMDRLAEAAHDRAAQSGNAFYQAFKDIQKSSETTFQAVTRKTEDMAAKTDPAQQAKLSTQRTIEDAKAQLQKIEDDKKMLRDKAYSAEAESVKAATQTRDAAKFETLDGNVEGKRNDEIINKELADRKRDAASTRHAAEQNINKQSLDLVKALNAQILQAEKTGAEDQVKIQQEKLEKIAANAKTVKEINAKAAADEKALDEKSQNTAMEMGNEMVADWKAQQKEKLEAAMQAQQDIIDANTAAQAQISKVGRLDKMANEAARSMIQSGQTALGQFNFATDGASNKAMAIAQKQLTSIEKIEAATAEQVRLTKESAGFR